MKCPKCGGPMEQHGMYFKHLDEKDIREALDDYESCGGAEHPSYEEMGYRCALCDRELNDEEDG